MTTTNFCTSIKGDLDLSVGTLVPRVGRQGATDFKKRALFERLARDYREIARDFQKIALRGEVSSDDAALLPGTGLF
jgi:hypothetical protein